MKITIIHGQSHEGSTYHMARILAEELGGEITEFFLPRDFGSFCVGCSNCFIKGETNCPHYEQLKPITQAMEEADVLIFASPVYVFHATGAMKAFLDHYGYRWMVHRPEEKMFGKIGICLSTAAGGGMKKTNKDMADSLFFWGVGKIYRYGVRVEAIRWEGIASERKEKICRHLKSLGKKVKRKEGSVKPGLSTRLVFSVMRFAHKREMNPPDTLYWKEKGWLEKKRPWK